MSPRQARGRYAEERARRFLENNGYRFLAANAATRFGEVDLVMEKDEFVVFVEVRERKSNVFGSPAETVDFRKQRRIAKAALAYAKAHALARRPLRFDIVGVQGDHLTHLENAFAPAGYTF